MFDFRFEYFDSNIYDVSDVTSIAYQTGSGTKLVSGDDILTTRLPLDTIHLFSESGCYTVSGTNLMAIEVTKQDE